MRVAVVGADGAVAMAPVTLGRDFGTEVEVLDGLRRHARVVVNPPDSLVDGQKVRVFETGCRRGGRKDAAK